ncbi:MAG: mechanosensitive ion channel, partial [Rivularia sp. ALOHA_DT_140]|nr:mechanosensitive ion channel [Rivularia sp. ALOHA_DT_140]
MLIKLFKDVTFINFALADISKSANQFVKSITTNLGSSIVNIIAALTILLLGLLLAAVIATTTRSLLKRTRFDDRIANKFRSNPNELGKFKLEKWIPIGIFGIIFGVSLIAFFEALQLKQFTKPINVLLKNINSYLPSLLGAAILLVIAWLLAKIVKFAATRSIRLLQLDERFNNQVEDLPQQNQLSISNAVPQALYWFILLFFLPIILDTLGLQATLEPVQKLVGEFLLYLPNILGALLIALLGWIIARTVRTIISSFLTAIGVDQLGAKFGMSTTAKGSLSWLGGTSVYVFILIFTAISALNKLDITTVSAPAIVTLNQVFVVIPQIITAIAILVIGYIAGKYVGELLRNVLTGINFNNLVMQLGLPNQLFNNENNSLILTPSEIVGTIARIGIILFAT